MKVYKSKLGYFYKIYKNGKKKRINKKEYEILRKINLKIKQVQKIIKEDKYSYPNALKYVEKYVKKYSKKNHTAGEIAIIIYQDTTFPI